jgi:hypothetical protein
VDHGIDDAPQSLAVASRLASAFDLEAEQRASVVESLRQATEALSARGIVGHSSQPAHLVDKVTGDPLASEIFDAAGPLDGRQQFLARAVPLRRRLSRYETQRCGVLALACLAPVLTLRLDHDCTSWSAARRG